jgi:hypothetical protein
VLPSRRRDNGDIALLESGRLNSELGDGGSYGIRSPCCRGAR